MKSETWILLLVVCGSVQVVGWNNFQHVSVSCYETCLAHNNSRYPINPCCSVKCWLNEFTSCGSSVLWHAFWYSKLLGPVPNSQTPRARGAARMRSRCWYTLKRLIALCVVCGKRRNIFVCFGFDFVKITGRKASNLLFLYAMSLVIAFLLSDTT